MKLFNFILIFCYAELNRLKSPDKQIDDEILYNKIIANNNNISYKELFQPKVNNCNQCKQKFGKCDSNICYCNEGYLNHPNANEKFSYICSYKQKNKKYAILLELFTFIGGDLYLGFYIYAIVKSLIFIILFILFFMGLPCSLFGCGESLIQGECKPCTCIKSGNILTLLFLIFIWIIGDILILTNKLVLDSNKMPII